MPRISLAQRMNGASRMSVAAADQYTPMVLDYDSLIPSEENFYPISEIEELADNMLVCGHIEPVVVGRVKETAAEEEKDRIVSGHRRYYAIGLNIERGHLEFCRVNCVIRKMTHTMYLFTLASANAFTRKLDDAALVRQAAVLRSTLKELVESGEVEIQGKMRDYLADTLGISGTKMAQVDKINSSLIPEGRQALESGKMNFSKAYETARLPEEAQRVVIEDEGLLSADVRSMVKDMKITCTVSEAEPRPETDMEDPGEERDIRDTIQLPASEQVQEQEEKLSFCNSMDQITAYVKDFGLSEEQASLKRTSQVHRDMPNIAAMTLRHEAIIKGFELILADDKERQGGE